MRLKWLGLMAVFFTPAVFGQQMQDMILQTEPPSGEGWRGFMDLTFLINASLNLLLAAVLGAIIAYHPRHKVTGPFPQATSGRNATEWKPVLSRWA